MALAALVKAQALAQALKAVHRGPVVHYPSVSRVHSEAS